MRLNMENSVSIEPFRTYVEKGIAEGRFTLGDICGWLGWIRYGAGGREQPDTSRLLRTLGMKNDKADRTQPRQRMSYDVAVKLCDALGIDYWEVGV